MVEPRHNFAEQLRDLEQDLIRLGSVAGLMLQKAMRSLKENDPELARAVIDQDDVADDLDLLIETRCMRLLAQQQPMARDLRTIGSILKAIADLERIADFSCDIALEVIPLAAEPRYPPPARLFGMGDRVLQMVSDTLDCFTSRDLAAVQRLCTTQDDEIDDLYREITDQLLAHVKEEPEVVTHAARLLFVAHYLERIADHCTNVGERIHYIETGQLKQLNIP